MELATLVAHRLWSGRFFRGEHMSSHFAQLLAVEIDRMAAERMHGAPQDLHVHFCDIDPSVMWSEQLFAEVLSVLADRVQGLPLVPHIVFQVVQVHNEARAPESMQDVVALLSNTTDDPPAVYLFTPNEVSHDRTDQMYELGKTIARLDGRWSAYGSMREELWGDSESYGSLLIEIVCMK